MMSQNNRDIVGQDMYHPYKWWEEDANRKNILRKTFLEGSDDSEDEFGNPRYIQSKDENY
mgnify:CR=1 FL=1|jgi:hypothetical protein